MKVQQKIGCKIYGYISGYGSSTDAYHITAPSEGGVGALRAMEQAISNADISKEKIDYINAHGTSTPANDLNETLAIKSLMNTTHMKLISLLPNQ